MRDTPPFLQLVYKERVVAAVKGPRPYGDTGWDCRASKAPTLVAEIAPPRPKPRPPSLKPFGGRTIGKALWPIKDTAEKGP